MARFAFFIYGFNGPIMERLFRQPRNDLQVEQGVISMLAGDLFDSCASSGFSRSFTPALRHLALAH